MDAMSSVGGAGGDGLRAAGVVGGAAAGGFVAQHAMMPHDAAAASASTAAANTTVRPGSRVGVPDFTSIVDENGAAVVNVSVVGKAEKTAGAQMPELDPGNPFYEFFRQ